MMMGGSCSLGSGGILNYIMPLLRWSKWKLLSMEVLLQEGYFANANAEKSDHGCTGKA